MKNITTLCALFYGANNIPLFIFPDHEDPVIYSFDKDLIPMFARQLAIESHDKEFHNPDIRFSNDHSVYGIIRLEDLNTSIVMGPCFTSTMSRNMIHDFLKENAVSNEKTGIISEQLFLLPTTSLSQIMSKICLLYYVLTEISVDPFEHFYVFRNDFVEKIKKEETDQSVSSKELQAIHNTYYWEKELYHIISTGDMLHLKEYLTDMATVAKLTEGVVAGHPIRQAKNIFIGFVTKLGMMGAIPGGMDIEETYRLIDTYVRECEAQNNIDSILNLYYLAATDFCSRISSEKIPAGLSPDIFKCMQYIKNHSNENICIQDVAENIQKSSSFVISHFKSELGITVGAYISRCKLEEAKSLLTFSSLSLSEISNYLSYSSQAYFQNLFKRQYGMTPLAYRKKTRSL
ncbi:MAG: helix-turn-helix domain-containing protein [Butyrivibrio sp.]|nr:helix-turn-helix domain-containing protein [Butyrivibrio sp.]